MIDAIHWYHLSSKQGFALGKKRLAKAQQKFLDGVEAAESAATGGTGDQKPADSEAELEEVVVARTEL